MLKLYDNTKNQTLEFIVPFEKFMCSFVTHFVILAFSPGSGEAVIFWQVVAKP